MNIKKFLITITVFTFLFYDLTYAFAEDYGINKKIIASKITRSGGDVNVDGGGGGDLEMLMVVKQIF